MLVWGGQPAFGPTLGSFAYSYKYLASVSSQGRKINLLVSRIIAFSLLYNGFIKEYIKIKAG
jgi:hypothetical protein